MMGNTMETGLLVEWHVDEGDEVTEEDILAEVESEKASTEVQANQDGTLARVDVDAGESVPPGTVLGVVLGPDESIANAPEPRSRNDDDEDDRESDRTDSSAAPEESGDDQSTGKKEESERAAPGARKLAEEHDIDLATIDGTGPEGAVLRSDVEEILDNQMGDADAVVTATSEHDFTSPSTRRLARKLGVSLADIEGQGIGGRITESDVRAAAGRTDKSTTTQSTASSGSTADADQVGVTITEEQSLSGMRQTIADRMSQSAQQAPHVTLNREVDVDRAFETAEELSSQWDASVGFTDILVGASVRALEAYPVFNSWFEDETIRYVAERNVAVAVDTDKGLLTPVISSAEERSLTGIAAERRRLTEVVLDGEHTMEDLQGGTFTITNLGMFGVDSFDPIINPPQVAILGVGRVREDGDRDTCTLSLSFDHRVVDGADAARFLDTLTEGVESPSLVVADRSNRQAVSGGEVPDSTATGEGDIATAVTRDIAAQATEIAKIHDWEVPDFEVDLDGDRPSVAITSPNGANPATAKRLVYAACRESEYANTITGLKDPDISGF